MHQALFDAKRHGTHQWRLLRAGCMRVHVKQPRLVGIGLLRGSKVKRLINRCQQLSAVQMQIVERTSFDQRFDCAFVDF